MTADEATRIVTELANLDFTVQAQRDRALQLIAEVEAAGDVPASVSAAAAQAQSRLQAGGGVADQGPRDFRRRSEYLFGLFDVTLALSPLEELSTAAGRRYTEALVSAVASGDPAALNSLNRILEDENVKEETRRTISGLVEEVIGADREARGIAPGPRAATRERPDLGPGDGGGMGAGGQVTPASDGDGTTPPAGTGDAGSPLGMTDEEILAFLQGTPTETHYGVPVTTGEGLPWEAIVGDQTVAPQYPTGWSLQPARFGLTNEESIARAQILMEEAGLLQPGSYMPGVWDPKTAGRSNTEGFRAVLSFANVTGTDWAQAFSRLYDAGTDAAARGLRMELDRLNRMPYFDDPERLRERTRAFIRSMGRAESQITDEEVDRVMNMAAQGTQASLMAELERQIGAREEMGFGGQQALGALRGGEMPQGMEPQPQMDPISHFDTQLRSIMGREIESREAQAEAQAAGSRFGRIAGTIGSAN